MTSHGAVKDIDILHGFNKDELGYFVNEFTPEAFEVWAAERKTQMIDRLSEEDLERVTSFLNDAKGEEYERDSALFGQLWFNAAHFRMADEQANGGGKSYIYYFTPELTVPYIKSGHASKNRGSVR